MPSSLTACACSTPSFFGASSRLKSLCCEGSRGSIDETVSRRGIVDSAGVLERGKGMGWIAWEPERSRSRPRESKPAIGSPVEHGPWATVAKKPNQHAAAQQATKKVKHTKPAKAKSKVAKSKTLNSKLSASNHRNSNPANSTQKKLSKARSRPVENRTPADITGSIPPRSVLPALAQRKLVAMI